jgi:type VI secretion system protein ImpL
MWLWILSALFLALVWGVWFILRPAGPGPSAEVIPTWIPVAITAAVVLALVGLVVYRRIRAARAARALEKAIAQQAQEQALAAKPERRAEIQELHRQLQEGINALKSSKLGGGTDALYKLPWYVMVGPPGAGKTTALRHSGLVFPYLDPAGGGVKGVGGTRGCDWWFTNEAILLDTAGRYTTEADDHDEWMAFLEQLHKYRPDKPINGVICAVNMHDLVDATEEQVESTAKKVRARIDEMQSTLKMVVPVYVMFTKIDLIPGFVEFFGDLKKSERGQPFGATFKLDANKSEPGKLFDAEFDTLVERAHDRGLRRMATERSREVKERVYQFPLEFAAIKANLSSFLNAAFTPSKTPNLATPIMRGFYFTSGTQEGKPLDRVLGSMMRAFGMRPAIAEAEAPLGGGATEAKSYFLRDVFMNVIFPDKDIAARTAAEVRRQRLQRFAAAAIAAALAFVLLVPSVLSFMNNRALVAETSRISTEAAAVKWTDGGPPVDKVEKLDSLREHAQLLDQYREEGAPVSYRWGMYQGDKLFEPTKDQYIKSLREGFVKPVRARLEDRLANSTGAKYLEEYNDLKTYLLLGDEYKTHLLPEADAAWETGRLLQLWTDILRPNSDLSEGDLKAKLVPHVKYYVDLLRRGAIKGEDLDVAIIGRTRDTLARIGPTQRYYDRFVTTLEYEKYDENGPNSRDNLKYPPVALNELFADRPEVLGKIRSAQKERTGKWFDVRGPYTSKGHAQVVASLDEGVKVLERERWVVPLTQEEERQGDKIQQALARVRQDYDTQYIREWLEFFRDIQVEVPPNNKEAIQEYRVLATPDWPYQRLLRTLEDNTQFDQQMDAAEEALLQDGGLIDQIKTRVKRRIDSRVQGKLGLSGGRPTDLINLNGAGGPGVAYDPIPDKFRRMVRFGVPEQPRQTAEGVEPPPPAPAELSKYIGHLERLSAEMGAIEDAPPGASTQAAREKFGEAVRDTEQLILKMDETGQELMTPLLMNPLRQGYKAVMRSAGGSASGLWEVVVWPPFREKIKDRYPFDLSSSRDASFEDTVAFFKPKDGTLWGFYEQYLDPFHIQVGHDFIPKGGLEGSPRPAKPFTPFNAMLYPCLKRAHEITEAMWPDGPADKPSVAFNVNLKTVSPIVSEVVFEIDGQKRVYRNEKEFWHTFKWPGEKHTGAKLRVRGAGGLDEELTREGPWGIFRLFEAGTTTAEKGKDDVFTVTWQMTAPPVTVTMEVRPTRSNHPFVNSFFRATNCPPSIGDAFGGKKGS